MASSDIEDIENIFNNFSIKPDYKKELQENTINLDYEKWERTINSIPLSILNNNFIYVFLKIKEKSIVGIYIGKSGSKKTNRLKQHLEGLKNILNGDGDQPETFY